MSTITQFLFRRGSNLSRQSTLLAAGEPGLTTDSNRLFVGDGATYGGNIAGNINFGIFLNVIGGSNVYGSTSIDTTAYSYLSAGQKGDVIYDSSSNIVYTLNATPNGTPNPLNSTYLSPIARNVTLSASEFTFGNNSILSLATNAISGYHISSAATDNSTIVINPVSTVLSVATGSSTTGIQNVNLQWVPGNTIKGNFTGTTGSITDLTVSTGGNIYQYIGTADNTGLGTIYLSAGQNMTFSTITGTDVNGNNTNTVVIDSSPNIQAGDGITYNIDPKTDKHLINAYNSLQYIKPGNLYPNAAASSSSIIASDGTTIASILFPYYTSTNLKLSAIPIVSFETVAPVGNPPTISIYWTTSATNGSNVTVFASNSATKSTNTWTTWVAEAGRGVLFPSYWQQYSYYTYNWNQVWYNAAWNSLTQSWWSGGWTLQQSPVVNYSWADWPSTIHCMYLSGSNLWIGGNFQNIGSTAQKRRNGIACINLLSGANTSTGYVGSLITLQSSSTGAQILNGNGFGFNFATPGHSVRQITAFNNILCVGGCWDRQHPSQTPAGTSSDIQPSTSLALFDLSQNYALSSYQFIANGNVPATITALLSAGSFLYVAGNFYQCKRGSYRTSGTPTDYVDSVYVQAPGLTRIMLAPYTPTDPTLTSFYNNLPIGGIDTVFTANVAQGFFNAKNTSLPGTIWKYPPTCLDVVPNVSAAGGGSVLYVGGSHYAQTGNSSVTNYRYNNLTTHWLGNSANTADGSLTNFNALLNGRVNVITHDSNNTIYIGGNFTSFTSQRQVNQSITVPCNYVLALDTTGVYGNDSSSGKGGQYQSTDISKNGNYWRQAAGANGSVGGDYSTSTFTSADSPLIVPNWFPACNHQVTDIDFHEANPNNPGGITLSAVYLAGTFTQIGATKVPYLGAVVAPNPSSSIFDGFTPLQWFPTPNSPHNKIGQRGCNIIRIPYNSPLSGVLVAGNASMNNINGAARPGWARISGIGEATNTSNLSSITWSIAANVMGNGNYLNIDNTRVVSLSDNIGAPYTVNVTEIFANNLTSLFNVHRGDLCRFALYRPGAFTSQFGTPIDTFIQNVQVLGIKLDWDTKTAIGQYATNGYESFYPPASGVNTTPDS